MNNTVHCVVEARNTLGEGPIWDAEEQALYWLDITERIIHRYEPGSGAIRRWRTPSEVGSIALRRNGDGMVGGFRSGIGFFSPQSEKLEITHAPEAALAENRFNDGKCDPQGRFWCGSIHEVSDPSLRKPIAAVYRLDADGSLTRIRTGVRTSNGFAWSPDGATMYFTDTPSLQILAFDYDSKTGNMGNERVFATLPRGAGRPDGATVDTEGCLWSAHFDGWRVTRYSPKGEILRVVDLPVANVTSCAFGGPDLDTLYITTAREDLSAQELLEQPLAGALFAIEPGVRGMPAQRFAG